MYLRRHSKKVDGEDYGYWSLVESVRTARGPRQRIVATVGKLPGLDKEERIGWEEIRRILDGKPAQPSLFEKYEEPPAWATVNINRVSVERLRHFGDVYLATSPPPILRAPRRATIRPGEGTVETVVPIVLRSASGLWLQRKGYRSLLRFLMVTARM